MPKRAGAEPAGSGVEFALRRRDADGLLGGMYEFPGREVGAGAGGGAEDGVDPATGRALPAGPHVFSHLRMTYRPFLRRWPVDAEAPDGARSVGEEELADLPLPVAQTTILEYARAALRLRLT